MGSDRKQKGEIGHDGRWKEVMGDKEGDGKWKGAMGVEAEQKGAMRDE